MITCPGLHFYINSTVIQARWVGRFVTDLPKLDKCTISYRPMACYCRISEAGGIKPADTRRYSRQKYEILWMPLFGVRGKRQIFGVAKQRGSHIQHTTAHRPAGPIPILDSELVLPAACLILGLYAPACPEYRPPLSIGIENQKKTPDMRGFSPSLGLVKSARLEKRSPCVFPHEVYLGVVRSHDE